VQGDRDPALTLGPRRIILQAPVVARAVGEEPRPVAAGAADAVPIDTVGRVEEEAFAAWPLHGGAQETPGEAGVLRGVDLHTLAGVEEADQQRTVRDAPLQTDPARRPQRLIKGQFVEPVSVVSQGVFVATVAAKHEAAQLALAHAPGVPGGAVTEVEARPHVVAGVGPAVLELVPAGVLREVLLV